MKKFLLYEIAAAITALLGASILVCVYFPLLNPMMHRIETGHDSEPFSYYLLLTPIPLLILIASWCLNRTAQRLKEKDPKIRAHNGPSD